MGEQLVTEKTINWGGVLKGVALVAGIVVVAAIGWVALGGAVSVIGEAIAATPAVSQFFGTIGGAIAGMAKAVGLSGLVSGASVPGIGTIANITGALSGAAIATHITTPFIDNLHLTTTQTHLANTDPTQNAALLASQNNHAVTAAHSQMHDLTHMAHHAAEHADHHASTAWTERYAPKNAFGSFSAAVRNTKEDRKIEPRAAEGYIEKVNADREQLDQILAK